MFMVFTGTNYYPGGGWDDFRGFATSIKEARQITRRRYRSTSGSRMDDWYQIVEKGEDGVEIVENGVEIVENGSISDLIRPED